MADFSIRGYNPETDYAQVAANLQQAEMFDPDRDTAERLKQFAADILVAELGGTVVASVYAVNHVQSRLDHLVVAVEHRRKGIGTVLHNAALERLHQGGAKDLELVVHDKNHAASRWYHGLGYKDGGIYRSMWRHTRQF